MKRPDLIITWIKHSDYQLFRKFLRTHRDFFGKVIIYFSEHFRHMYFDKFIQQDLSDLNIIFLPNIEYKYGVEDWRNISTNYMLRLSDSDWVCSIEQDFFCQDWNKLLEATKKEMETSDLIGWWQPNGKYIHPAYWFMKREFLERTNKDFAAHDGFDHFGWITQDTIANDGKIKSLQDMGFNCDVAPNADCFHLGGVNQNYLEGLKPEYVFHRPEIFYVYNYWSMRAPVIQSENFYNLCKQIDEKLRDKFPNIDPKMDEYKKFFI